MVQVGNGQIGQQPTSTASVLPANVQLASASVLQVAVPQPAAQQVVHHRTLV